MLVGASDRARAIVDFDRCMSKYGVSIVEEPGVLGESKLISDIPESLDRRIRLASNLRFSVSEIEI